MFVTSQELVRKGDVPGIPLTRRDLVRVPSPSRPSHGAPPYLSRLSPNPGRHGPGHSLPGPWPRRPRPFPLPMLGQKQLGDAEIERRSHLDVGSAGVVDQDPAPGGLDQHGLVGGGIVGVQCRSECLGTKYLGSLGSP